MHIETKVGLGEVREAAPQRKAGVLYATITHFQSEDEVGQCEAVVGRPVG